MGNDILRIANNLSIQHNVGIRVLDATTGETIQWHEGHNAATNGMVSGIGHYLKGDSVFNQGYEMLKDYIPQYISLGTMGLSNQDADENGWPLGIDDYTQYMMHSPGFGADGYDPNENNDRTYLGLGPAYGLLPEGERFPINCELVSNSFGRTPIAFRDLIPEFEAELPQTVDVVLSAMVSAAALHEFRPEGQDYLFITEAGLWAHNIIDNGTGSGLLAGYRITPPARTNWVMIETDEVSAAEAEINKQKLRESIIRVGPNQVVQVIWKIQIGGMDQLGGINALYQHAGVLPSDGKLYWDDWA